jgi:hypothetical protein
MTRVEVQMEECEKFNTSSGCASARSVKSGALGLHAGGMLMYALAAALALALSVAL